MGKSLLICSGNTNTNTNSTRYWFPLGLTGWSSVEAETAMPFREAGTLSNFTVSVSSNSLTASYVLTMRKNGADSNAQITIPVTTTGEFDDTTSTETVSAGDKFCWEGVTTSSGSAAVRFFTMLFEPTDPDVTVSRFAVTGFAQHNSSTIHYYKLQGSISTFVTSDTDQLFVPHVAGTFRDAAAYSSVGGRAHIFRFRRNQDTSTDNTINHGSNITGLIENTSDTYAIDNNDNINWYSVYGGSGTQRDLEFVCISFETDNNKSIFITTDTDGNAIGQNLNHSFFLSGSMINSNNTITGIKAKEYFKFTDLQVYISANSFSQSTTFRLTKNASSTGLGLQIPASTTGRFTNNEDVETVVPTDEINYTMITPNVSGSITNHSMGIVAEWYIPTVEMTNVNTKTFANKFITKV